MRCQKQGHDNIVYICQSPKCNYLPLCLKCKEKHDPQHSTYFIRYQLALQKALKNLNYQISKLQQYIFPMQRKRQTLSSVSAQIEDLKKEKNRLVKKIQQQIDREIRILQQANGAILPQEQRFYQQLKNKLESLQEMKRSAQREVKTLRASLTLQIEHYLYTVGRNNEYFTSMRASERDVNMAQLYVKTQHEMIISQLQLRKEIINAKLLKKMKNQSPLYFLIDQKYQTSKNLHYFIIGQKSLQLRIFDVERQKWTKHVNQTKQVHAIFQNVTKFATISDHDINRYYLIGGKKRNRPIRDLVWYDTKTNFWQSTKMKNQRSNAMVTLVIKKNNKYQNNKTGNYILIAGGFDSDGRAIKSWQLFDPQINQILYDGQMNFACASGTLFTFNDTVVFKLGGLSNKLANKLTICPIIQKCDFSQINSDQKPQKFNFAYIELEDINHEGSNSLLSKYQLYYAGQGGIQINPNEILIYGGMTVDNNGVFHKVDETYLINVEKFYVQNFEGKKVQRYRYYARWINEKPLISGMSFEEFKPCIWKNRLFCLQNLPKRQDELYKGLIEFDMKSWYETQNIVDDKI